MTALEELTDLAIDAKEFHLMRHYGSWSIQVTFRSENGAELKLTASDKDSVEEAARQILAQRNAIFDAPRKAFASKLIEAPRAEIDDEIPF